ncbi:Androgen-dependent TFPI-regulating protein, partial [Galemys pyrenaicus]
HTCVLPPTLIEIILRPHCYPKKKKGLSLLTIACFAYIIRVLWLYFETGMWVYPVFAKLSPVGVAAFFFLSYICGVSIYLLGEKLNHWKW